MYVLRWKWHNCRADNAHSTKKQQHHGNKETIFRLLLLLLIRHMTEDDLIMAAAHAALTANIAVMEYLFDDEEEEEIDHRTLARSTRTIYFHAQALHCIRRDYLGTGTILPILEVIMLGWGRLRFGFRRVWLSGIHVKRSGFMRDKSFIHSL